MAELKKSDFYFDLPEELIAQDPLADRSSSRLLVLDKKTGEVEHHIFREIVQYLEPGDCLVLNNTKVIPARLLGAKEDTHAAVEVLLLKRRENDVWETLVKPGKKCKPGTRLVFGDGLLHAEVLETVEEGNRLIRFSYEGIFEEILDRLGEMCPRFAFSNKISLSDERAEYRNSQGRHLVSSGRSIDLSLLAQNRGSGNLFDTGLSYEGNCFDEDGLLAQFKKEYDAFYTPPCRAPAREASARSDPHKTG